MPGATIVVSLRSALPSFWPKRTSRRRSLAVIVMRSGNLPRRISFSTLRYLTWRASSFFGGSASVLGQRAGHRAQEARAAQDHAGKSRGRGRAGRGGALHAAARGFAQELSLPRSVTSLSQQFDSANARFTRKGRAGIVVTVGKCWTDRQLPESPDYRMRAEQSWRLIKSIHVSYGLPMSILR